MESTENNVAIQIAELGPKVGENPLIVQHILKNLHDTPNELLSQRFVSSLWEDVATNVLITNQYFELSFQSNEKPNKNPKILLDSPLHLIDDPFKSLTNLTECLTTSRKFPCVQYRFPFPSSDLHTTNISNFFTLHGRHIKSLSLYLQSEEEEEFPLENVDENLSFFKSFQNFLTQSSNLTSLTISNVPPSWNEIPGIFSDPLQTLPKLISLDLDLNNQPKFSRQLIRAAFNLEDYLETLTTESIVHHLQFFVEINKVHTIRSVEITPSEDSLHFYCHNFKSALPSMNLQRIDLKLESTSFESFQKVSSLIHDILEENEIYLEQFILSINEKDVGLLRLPEMSNVTSLHLLFYHNFESTVKTSTVDWSEAFPSVEEINFWQNQGSIKILPFGNPMLSVTSLDFETRISLEACAELPRIFPNLKTLIVKQVSDFPGMFKKDGLGGLEKLEMLDLEIFSGDLYPNNSYPHFDAALTGFSAETVWRLNRMRFMEMSVEEMEEVERERTQNSILDFKCLKELRMKFWGPSLLCDNPYDPMTEVSGRWAFCRMCPRVTVYLSMANGRSSWMDECGVLPLPDK